MKMNNSSMSSSKSFNMITKDLLFITGNRITSNLNANKYIISRIINVCISYCLYNSCLLNEKIILNENNKK